MSEPGNTSRSSVRANSERHAFSPLAFGGQRVSHVFPDLLRLTSHHDMPTGADRLWGNRRRVSATTTPRHWFLVESPKLPEACKVWSDSCANGWREKPSMAIALSATHDPDHW